MTPQDQIYSVPTNLGLAKMAYAQANRLSVNITHMAIGDGNGVPVSPDATWPGLAREVHRAQLNQMYQHDQNPNWFVAELVLPPEVGGWTIREIALYDDAGDLIYIGNHAEQYKPIQSQGSDETKTIRMVILVSSTSTVTLRTDPTTVLATVDYVQRELAKLDYKQSARFATKGNISLQGLGVQAGGDWSAALTAGDRVLVRGQTAAKENGIYVAAGGVWVRASDADASVEVTAGLVISVEQGVTLADTIWQLITDGPITIGITGLTFRDITDGFARLLSPTFAGTPTAPTAPQFTASQQLATTEFVQRAVGNMRGVKTYNAAVVLTTDDLGKSLRFGYSGYTVTVPKADSTVADGSTLLLFNTGLGDITVAAQAGDHFAPSKGHLESFVLGLGDHVLLIKQLATEWTMLGSVQLPKSPAFAGPNFVTAPQFDSSQRLATTEFVKRQGVQRSGFASLTASTALSVDNVGGLVSVASAAATTITLPATAGVPQGGTVEVVSTGAGVVTVAPAGADVVMTSSGVSGSIGLGQGDSAEFIRLAGQWRLVGGSVMLRYSQMMGESAFTTQPKFSSDKKLATTEFVRKELGNYSFLPLNTGRTLTAADAGKCFDWYASSNGTIVLPLVADLVAGAAFKFQNISSYKLVIQTQGGNELFQGSVNASSITLGPGDSLEVLHDSARWISIGGSAALKGAAVFDASIATIGRQLLPSGLLEQWTMVTLSATGKGVATYPQTLSTVFAVHPVGIYGGTYYGVSVDSTPGLSSCALICSAAVPINVYVRILGKL